MVESGHLLVHVLISTWMMDQSLKCKNLQFYLRHASLQKIFFWGGWPTTLVYTLVPFTSNLTWYIQADMVMVERVFYTQPLITHTRILPSLYLISSSDV